MDRRQQARGARRRARTAVLAGAVLGVGLASGANADEMLAIGSLDLGMSIDAIRAAAPQAAWRDRLVSPFTSRVFGISSTAPVEIHGLPFAVDADVHYYRRELRLMARVPAADAKACEQTALGWLAAAEKQVGRFESEAPRVIPGRPGNLEWHTQTSPSGSVTVMPSMGHGTPDRSEGERVGFGEGSTALVDAYDSQFRPRPRRGLLGGQAPHFTLTTARRVRGQQFDVAVEYDMSLEPVAADADAAAVPRKCVVRAALQRRVEPPAPEPFDASRHPVRSPLTLAERHLVYPRDAPALDAPIDVEFRCDVSRQLGAATACHLVSPAGLHDALENVARRMIRAVLYDMSGVDRDDPQGLRGPIRVRLEPTDRQPLDFLAASRTPLGDVVWTQAPEEGELENVSVFGVVEPSESTPPVEVSLACRILGDGSLVCLGTGDDPAYLQATAARLAGTLYRASPTLRDGGSSVGRVVDLELRFRPSL